MPESTLSQPPADRILNAPTVTVLLAASMPALYLVQIYFADQWMALAFRPSSLWDGAWWPGILTSMFLHDGWTHVAMNAVGALAFGPPVARLLARARGVGGFLLFYIVCGLAATAGYGVVHPDSHHLLVGASGAVFGLMGAALRLLGRRNSRLRPLRDRRFLTTAAVLMVVNAAVGLVGFAPGMDGARIAWEAHAFGFLCGALLIGPWARAFESPPPGFASPPDLRDPDV